MTTFINDHRHTFLIELDYHVIDHKNPEFVNTARSTML